MRAAAVNAADGGNLRVSWRTDSMLVMNSPGLFHGDVGGLGLGVEDALADRVVLEVPQEDLE